MRGEKFYSVYDHDTLELGKNIKVERTIFSNDEALDIAPYINQSQAELKAALQDSHNGEKAVFNKLQEVLEEWARQAGQTILYRKTLEYLQTPPVKHTSNEWVESEYNMHEISNMVYVMRWHSYTNTEYDRELRESVPVSWDLTWSLRYNAPKGYGEKIAGQERKHFKDEAAMQKYMQGRIAAYAHLFVEILPPIPKGEEKQFSVNGLLLPGYRVYEEQPALADISDSLLDSLAGEYQPREENSAAEIFARVTKKRAAHNASRSEIAR